MAVYPSWLSHLLPEYSRIGNAFDANDHNYFMISGYGYPSIFDYIEAAVHEINETKAFDFLLVCIDADEVSPQERMVEIEDFLSAKKLNLQPCILKIIVQNRCFETWLLGNRKVFNRQPERSLFRQFVNFYNVLESDPELMGFYPDFANHARFHEAYLKEMLAERNLKYSKTHPGVVRESAYLAELTKRADAEERHLSSFKYLLDFLKSC